MWLTTTRIGNQINLKMLLNQPTKNIKVTVVEPNDLMTLLSALQPLIGKLHNCIELSTLIRQLIKPQRRKSLSRAAKPTKRVPMLRKQKTSSKIVSYQRRKFKLALLGSRGVTGIFCQPPLSSAFIGSLKLTFIHFWALILCKFMLCGRQHEATDVKADYRA